MPIHPTIASIALAQIEGLRASATVFAAQADAARATADAADAEADAALQRADELEAALLASGWEPPTTDTPPDPPVEVPDEPNPDETETS